MLDIELPNDEKISEKLAIQAILAILAKLSILSMPRTATIYHKCHPREPFVVEVNGKVFHLLIHLLTITHKRVLSENEDRAYYLSLIIFCLRILNVNIHRMLLCKISPESVGLTIAGLGELRDMLLMFDSDSWVPSSAPELATDLKRIQLEACETLTIGFELFYPSHTLQARFVLNLLSLQSHKSKKKQHEGYNVLLIQLLDLLTNHPNPSYLLHPPEEDAPLDPQKTLYPMVNQLFNIAFTSDDSASVHTRQQILDYPMLKVGISTPSLHLLFAIQKNLVLRVLETDFDNTNIFHVFSSFAQLILSKCTDLLQGTAESVTISNGRTMLISDSSSVVLRTLLSSLVQALFLFTSNTWIANQLLPNVNKLISVLDIINTTAKKPNAPVLERSLSKEYLRGRSRISETSHPYESYKENLDVVTFRGSSFLSLNFDENCKTKDENDFLQIFSDTTLSKPIHKFYGNNWPNKKVIVAGDTVVFSFKSNHSPSSYWGYKCQVTGYMSRIIVGNSSWSVELEKTLCGLGGRFAATLIKGQPLSLEENTYKSLFKQSIFSSGLEEKYLRLLTQSITEPKYEPLTPRERSQTDNIAIFVDEIKRSDLQEFCEEIAEYKGEGAGLFDYFYQLIEPLEIEKGVELHMKAALRYMFAVLLKHNGFLKEALSFRDKQNKPLQSYSSLGNLKAAVKASIKLLDNKNSLGAHSFQNILNQLAQELKKVAEDILQNYHSGFIFNSLEEGISIKRENSFNSKLTGDLKTICASIIQRAQLLLKFTNSNISVITDITTTKSTSEVLTFLSDTLPIDQISTAIQQTCVRGVYRSIGLLKMKEMLECVNFRSMKNEIICFLGPSLRGSGEKTSSWPNHYLDDIECCSIQTREKISNHFESLMTLAASYFLSGDNSLELLVLDSFVLTFNLRDHTFLHSIDIFGLLYKLFSSISTKVSTAARQCFHLLGAICFASPNDEKVTPLQQSFFELAASQLEECFMLQSYPASDSILDLLSKSDTTSVPSNQRLNEKIENIISLLCTICASEVAKKCLSSVRFLRIFIHLIIVGNERIKLYAFRLLSNVLPATNADTKMDKDTLLSTLFSILGSVVETTIPLFNSELDSVPSLSSFIQSYLKHPETSPVDNRRAVRDSAGSRLELSHPFFPVTDSLVTLPSGWDRSSAKSSDKCEFLFSGDNRTVTLSSLDSEDVAPRIIKANIPISPQLQLFYFEVRIENAGEGDYIFIGLSSAKGRDKDKVIYAYNRSGKILKPPMENEYGPPFTTDDIIGCGFDVQSNSIFFTKNGEYLGPAFRNVQGKFYPVVGINVVGTSLLVNFGQMPFRYEAQDGAQKDLSLIKVNSSNLFLSELVSILRNLYQSPHWEEAMRKEIKDSLDNLLGFFETKKRKKRSKRKLIKYYHKAIASFTILGAPIAHLHLGVPVRYQYKNTPIDAVVVDVDRKSQATTIAYYQDKIIRRHALAHHLKLSLLPFPTFKLFDDHELLTKFESVMQQLYTTISRKPDDISFSDSQNIIVESSDSHNFFDSRGEIAWLQLFNYGVTAIANSIKDASSKVLLEFSSLFQICVETAQQLNPQPSQDLDKLYYLLLFLHSAHAKRSLANKSISSKSDSKDDKSHTIDQFNIGQLYRVGKIGNGMEWCRAMNKTISYTGFASDIDPKLKLVLITFLHHASLSSIKYWYSYDTLALRNTTNYDNSSNRRMLFEGTLKAICIERCREIITNSFFISIKADYNFQNTLYTNLNMINYIKHEIIKYTTYYAKSMIENRGERVPSSLRILQNYILSLIKRDKLERIPNKSNSQNKSISKSGFLLKKRRQFRSWSKFYFILHDENLYYYKSKNSYQPIGAVSLFDITNIEIKNVKKNKFKITTNSRVHIFQANSEEEVTSWTKTIQDELAKRAGDIENRRTKLQGSNNALTLSHLLMKNCMDNLSQITTPLPFLTFESPHPYSPNTMLKQLIYIPDADGLIITFDPQTHIKSSTHTLYFYSTGFESQRIVYASFCGKGVGTYPPLIIENRDRIWMEFHTDNTGSEWGYRFNVQALSIKETSQQILSQPHFEFSVSIIDWLTNLSSIWIRGFYTKEVFYSLCNYLKINDALHRKLRVINVLIRLVRRFSVIFTKEFAPDLYYLHFLKSELFAEIDQQKKSGVYSMYLQRLAELIINVEMTIQTLDSDCSKSTQNSVNNNSGKIDEAIENKLRYKAIKEPSWFIHSVNATKVMKKVLDGELFPESFVKLALYQAHTTNIVQESPHPYPSGVRVTANVYVPNATRLLITFDAKSVIESGYDHLMFSKHMIGADDLGGFTGDFGGKQFEIDGDFFIWSFLSDSSGNDNSFWGFRFTVTPFFLDDINSVISDKIQVDYEKAINSLKDWSLSMDYEFIFFTEKLCEKKPISSFDIQWNDFDFKEFLVFQLPMEKVRIRFHLLKYLNFLISNLLPLVDMRYVNENWSLGYMVGAMRRLIFVDIQQSLLEDNLFATRSYRTIPMITLDRQPTANGKKKEMMFIQGFLQLHYLEPSLLRSNDRAWAVKLIQEGATDVGGPYREVISEFCSELTSNDLNLFIPCPNGRLETGFNRDKLIPNPRASSPWHLQQFEFIGKLIGIAIRTKNSLNISLSSIVWKPLVSIKVNFSDLEAIDQHLSNTLKILRNCEDHGITEESFSDILFEVFTTHSSDGRLIELKKNGKNMPVTWENRLKYIKCVEKYRLNEFNLQINAIAIGISTIIPFHLLSCFTWQQLEERVCGNVEFDLQLLKNHTVYRNISEFDNLITNFWKVLGNFTAKEKQLFLRFVWGRSNLPRESDFRTPFSIQLFSPNAPKEEHDKYLPIAQTCFFSISLPAYSTLEIMRERLLYAITSCKEIDTDFIVPDENQSILGNDIAED